MCICNQWTESFTSWAQVTIWYTNISWDGMSATGLELDCLIIPPQEWPFTSLFTSTTQIFREQKVEKCYRKQNGERRLGGGVELGMVEEIYACSFKSKSQRNHDMQRRHTWLWTEWRPLRHILTTILRLTCKRDFVRSESYWHFWHLVAHTCTADLPSVSFDNLLCPWVKPQLDMCLNEDNGIECTFFSLLVLASIV